MKSAYKRLRKECDDLWGECVLLAAGFKSEISGINGKQIDPNSGSILDPHHIARKPNNRLRYELKNGICLTKWEHRYGIHGDYEEEYRDAIKRVRGEDIYEKMALLRNQTVKDLRLVKEYLEQERDKLRRKYDESMA